MIPDSTKRQSTPLRNHQSYFVGNAEVVNVPINDESLVPDLRADTRAFLRTSGIDIGDSELLHVQEACRDPNARPTNLLLIRKQCTLAGRPRITMVFLI
jgi:hypothetical protein